MEFKGKTVWVTGASSGIGEALAHGLAKRGARIILSGRRVDALERIAKSLSAETHLLPFEATDYDALPAVVAKAEKWKGGVDLLINNAGVSQRSLALDTSFDVYRTLMEVDFFAPLRLTQLVLPAMVERKSGAIAVVSSVAGKVGAPIRTGYCAAKHAVVGYFEALRAEVEIAYGISVHVILPGSVKTGVSVNSLTGDGTRRGKNDVNIENGMEPERAADIILDGIAAGARDIPVAEGMELMALTLRAQNPEALYGFTAQEGARLAEARAKGEAVDPGRVND
ncbi:MAG: SDR family NAD(P)-dependent oxidoreductase [Parvularculaceae bacterium]|nr:SDR family NAD(P)-dependent oxidoreductase [Parvularculaceae bacterium]